MEVSAELRGCSIIMGLQWCFRGSQVVFGAYGGYFMVFQEFFVVFLGCFQRLSGTFHVVSGSFQGFQRASLTFQWVS